jgi:hypothetical protein
MNNITFFPKTVSRMIRSTTLKDSFVRKSLNKYEKNKIKEIYRQHKYKTSSGSVKKK